jgi:protease I
MTKSNVNSNTANDRLHGTRIAAIATDGFERSELVKTKELLEDLGASVDVIAPKAGSIRSWDDKNWGDSTKVDVALADAGDDDYDALVIPGGVINPDQLRLNGDAVDFIRRFSDNGKLVAAICHGPQMLIEADLVDGKQLTSWPSLQTDLRNAGAVWEDHEVVVDGALITSRKPDDIPAFVQAIADALVNDSAQASPAKGVRSAPRAGAA